MLQQLRQSLPERAPNFFFLDIPRDDLPPFRDLLKQQAPDAKLVEVPMMRGRVTALNGTPSEQIKARDDLAWVLEGDRGITFATHPPEGAQVVEGTWWPENYQGPPLLSFDAEIAKGFDLKIGDTVSVNVLGRIIEARIANFRRIEWQSLGINFVLVFSPGAFAGAPAEEPGVDHARVVHRKQVAGRKQFGQFAEAAVFERSGGAAQHQQARVGTAPRRVLGNQFRREMKVEVTESH